MAKSIATEIASRKDYLQSNKLSTIYFGGGTPSLLNEKELTIIFKALEKNFDLSNIKEFTIEANPDDISAKSINFYKNLGVTRFSLGVQSFFNEDLIWMNRSHNATQADYSIKLLQDMEFENLTMDLIYGYPLLSDKKWIENLNQLKQYSIEHFSAYALTVEEKTPLFHQIKLKKAGKISDYQQSEQFDMCIDFAKNNNFEQYEISNFARNSKYAIHNTNYWQAVEYLGVGPGAHSFDGQSRRWNISNNNKYLSALNNGDIYWEKELLSVENKVNEYLMTSLRTKWGCDLKQLFKSLDSEQIKSFNAQCAEFEERKWLILEEETLYLTDLGKHYADKISSELFVNEMEN